MKNTIMIKKNQEFKNVFSKGKYAKGNLINVFVKKNNQNFNKLGIAISKKAGNSVKRNKIKRLIRENYKIIENELKYGNSIIILWKKQSNFEDFDFYKIGEECKNLFINLKIL